MIVLGIDPGTACGWAVLRDGERVASGTWDLRSKRHEGGGMRYLRARRSIIEAIEAAQPDAVAYEEVARHRGTAAAHIYGGIVAQLTAVCEELEVPYQGVPVNTVKKAATGKGNAGKPAIMAAAERRWGVEAVTFAEDEADALWTAWTLGDDLWGWGARG